jgi:hypothetical protein
MSFCEHCGSESDLCFCAVPLPTLERQTNNQPHNFQPQCLVKDCVVCMISTHGPAHLIDGKRVPTEFYSEKLKFNKN